MGTLHMENRGGIAVLTLDNPPVNALSIEMGQHILHAVEQIEHDDSVLAVILTGAGGKAFVAGADIKEFPRYISENIAEETALQFDSTLERLHKLGKPTIAALNGLTLGGGLEVALACDFRFAEEQVMIGLPEVKLGLFPGAGGTQRLPRLIGESRAKELILTGEPISAQQALSYGLVNRVVETGKVLSSAIEFATGFTTRSLQSIRRAKQAIDEGLEHTLEEGLKIEARLFGEMFDTNDVKEGVSAFIEKRAPKFTHS